MGINLLFRTALLAVITFSALAAPYPLTFDDLLYPNGEDVRAGSKDEDRTCLFLAAAGATAPRGKHKRAIGHIGTLVVLGGLGVLVVIWLIVFLIHQLCKCCPGCFQRMADQARQCYSGCFQRIQRKTKQTPQEPGTASTTEMESVQRSADAVVDEDAHWRSAGRSEDQEAKVAAYHV